MLLAGLMLVATASANVFKLVRPMQVTEKTEMAKGIQKAPVTTQPAGEAVNYKMSVEGMYYDENYSVECGANTYIVTVVFAEDAETVWFKGLMPSYKDAWVKGTLNEDGSKIIVPMGQSVYYSSYYMDDVVLVWGTSSVDLDEGMINLIPDESVQEVAFNFDIQTGAITMEEGEGDITPTTDGSYSEFVGTGLGIIWSEDRFFEGNLFWKLSMEPIELDPAVPADPVVTDWYDSNTERGYSKLSFIIKPLDVNGNDLVQDFLSYSIYTDNDQLFTFDAQTYAYDFEEDMTEIPYGFLGYDFGTNGVYFYRTNAEGYEPFFTERIGVQTHYTVNGVKNSSNIVYWYLPTKIESVYMVGTFEETQWSTDEGQRAELVEDGAGYFMLEGKLLKAGDEFKFIVPSPDGGWLWYGGVDENEQGYFELNENYLNTFEGIDLVDGSNFKVTETGLYDFYVDVNNMKVFAFFYQPYFLSGNFNGWATDEAPMIYDAENYKATITLDLAADAEFKVISPDATANDGWCWYGGLDENEVGYFEIKEDMDGEVIDLLKGEGSNFKVKSGGNYTLTIIQSKEEGMPKRARRAPADGLKLLVNINTQTSVNDVNATKGVSSVKYVNLAGQVSDAPFEGVNLQVTTMSDGSKKVVKLIK